VNAFGKLVEVETDPVDYKTRAAWLARVFYSQPCHPVILPWLSSAKLVKDSYFKPTPPPKEVSR